MMPVARDRIRMVFQKLERDLIKLSSRSSPETVHRFRTGVRRMEMLCEELLPVRDRNQKKLLKTLSRIRKRVGKVRDIDAQLEVLRTLKVSEEPRRKTQLIQALLDRRREGEKKLRKEITNHEVRELRKRLRRARKTLHLEQLRDPLQVAQQMLAQLKATQQPTEALLHQYRILTKRARYIAEFAPKSQRADRLIAQLKRAQDALGNWHDWLILTHTAADRLGDVHQSPLVALLHNLTGTKFRKAVAASRTLHPSDSQLFKRSSSGQTAPATEGKTSDSILRDTPAA